MVQHRRQTGSVTRRSTRIPRNTFSKSFGTGAKLEPEFGSTVAYHSRDRRQVIHYLFSLLPGFPAVPAAASGQRSSAGRGLHRLGVALYACPDDQGLATIEKIILAEGLPHIMIDGKWVRDPSAFGATLNWNGPHDKCIEYAEALGLKDISRDTGEFYPCAGQKIGSGRVGFAIATPMTYKEFTEECPQERSEQRRPAHAVPVPPRRHLHDVTPVPSEHLQTVCRTKLAKDISRHGHGDRRDRSIVPGGKGTWPWATTTTTSASAGK